MSISGLYAHQFYIGSSNRNSLKSKEHAAKAASVHQWQGAFCFAAFSLQWHSPPGQKQTERTCSKSRHKATLSEQIRPPRSRAQAFVLWDLCSLSGGMNVNAPRGPASATDRGFLPALPNGHRSWSESAAQGALHARICHLWDLICPRMSRSQRSVGWRADLLTGWPFTGG